MTAKPDFRVSVAFKKHFFDRSRVTDQLSEKRLKALRTLGGYIRKVARNSQKRKGQARKKPKNQTGKAFVRWQEEIANRPASPPGTPPNCHSPDDNVSLKKILFAYDGDDSAVVGAVLLHTARKADVPLPRLLEKGGTVTVAERRIGGTWVPVPHGQRGKQIRIRKAKLAARPTMGPALQAAASNEKLNQLLSQSIS